MWAWEILLHRLCHRHKYMGLDCFQVWNVIFICCGFILLCLTFFLLGLSINRPVTEACLHPFLNQNHLTPDLFAATPWFAEINRWLAKIPPIDKSGKGQAGYWWCDHWWWCQWFTCCVTSVASPPPPPCPPPLIWRQSLSIVHQPLLPQLTEHRPPRSSQSL